MQKVLGIVLLLGFLIMDVMISIEHFFFKREPTTYAAICIITSLILAIWGIEKWDKN